MPTCALGAIHVRDMRADILFAPFQLQLRSLRSLAAPPGAVATWARAASISSLRGPSTTNARCSSAWCKRRGSAVVAHAVLIVLRFRNVVVLEQLLRAIPIELGLIVLRPGIRDRRARLLDFLRTRAGQQCIQPRLRLPDLGFFQRDVAFERRIVATGPGFRSAGIETRAACKPASSRLRCWSI